MSNTAYLVIYSVIGFALVAFVAYVQREKRRDKAFNERMEKENRKIENLRNNTYDEEN